MIYSQTMLWRGNRLTNLYSSPFTWRGRSSFFSSKHFNWPSAESDPSPVSTKFEDLPPPDIPNSVPETWYTLSFLHNISTPLSTLVTLIDDLVPALQPSIAQTLQSTVKSLLLATTLHGKSLRGQWQTERMEMVSATQKVAPLLHLLAAPYTLYLKLPNQPIRTSGSPAAWEQILVNLVKNSREILYQDGVDSWMGWIELRILIKRNRWLLIWSDSGWGVMPAVWQIVTSPLPKGWQPQMHGFGLRSVRFWWENSFHGSLSLKRWPRWRVLLQAPRHD